MLESRLKSLLVGAAMSVGVLSCHNPLGTSCTDVSLFPAETIVRLGQTREFTASGGDDMNYAFRVIPPDRGFVHKVRHNSAVYTPVLARRLPPNPVPYAYVEVTSCGRQALSSIQLYDVTYP